MTIEELDRLRAGRNPGYLGRPIPDPLDEEIRELVAPVLAGGWEALCPHVEADHHGAFRLYAERMAAFAVRQGQPELLEAALAALAVGGLDAGSRDALAVVPLVYRSAEILGADPGALFEKVAGEVGEKAAATLRAFPRRENRSISAMGYEEVTDEEGFRYRRTW